MLPTVLVINLIICTMGILISLSLEAAFSGGVKDIGDFRKIFEQLLTTGYSISGTYLREKMYSNITNDSDVDEAFFIIVNFVKTVMIAIEVASCVYCYKKAIQMEDIDVITPDKESFHSTLDTINNVTNKILSNFKEGNTSEEQIIKKQIVLWLRANETNSQIRDLIRTLEEKNSDVEINPFFSFDGMKKFLKVLFGLKPTLSTTRAADKLRIVMECSEAGSVEELVLFLKNAGASVPLLIYKLPMFDGNKVLTKLKAKYELLLSCDELNDIKEFCTSDTLIYLVGTKGDLEDEKTIVNEGIEFVQHNNLNKFFKVSSKTGSGVEDLIKTMLKERILSEVTIDQDIRKGSFDINSKRAKRKDNCSC